MSLFRTLKCFMSAFRISYFPHSLLSRAGSTKALRAVTSRAARRNLMNDEITAPPWWHYVSCPTTLRLNHWG